MPTTPRVCGVDRDYVQIACETKVLETIVEYKAVNRQVFNCAFTSSETVGITNHRGFSNESFGQ
jgi:hypothetical protein